MSLLCVTKQGKRISIGNITNLLISELLIAAMEQDATSVRELAKEAGVSPTIIQAQGMTLSQLLDEYPNLQKDDILACLLY